MKLKKILIFISCVMTIVILYPFITFLENLDV